MDTEQRGLSCYIWSENLVMEIVRWKKFVCLEPTHYEHVGCVGYLRRLF